MSDYNRRPGDIKMVKYTKTTYFCNDTILISCSVTTDLPHSAVISTLSSVSFLLETRLSVHEIRKSRLWHISRMDRNTWKITHQHGQKLCHTSYTLSLKMAYTSHVNIKVSVCQRAHYSTQNESWHTKKYVWKKYTWCCSHILKYIAIH